jgi:hypothetical protein
VREYSIAARTSIRGRIRSWLEKYYATAGAEDPLSIELPARTYVPQFRRLAPAAPPPSRHWSCAPRRRAVLPGAW